MTSRLQRTPHEHRVVCDVHGVVATSNEATGVQAAFLEHANCETGDAQD